MKSMESNFSALTADEIIRENELREAALRARQTLSDQPEVVAEDGQQVVIPKFSGEFPWS
jgi:hypothetical protein